MLSPVLIFSTALAATVAAQTSQAVTGKLGDAEASNRNPARAAFMATLGPSNAAAPNLAGTFLAKSGAGGRGVDFTLQVTGLPDPSLGPFSQYCILIRARMELLGCQRRC